MPQFASVAALLGLCFVYGFCLAMFLAYFLTLYVVSCVANEKLVQIFICSVSY